MESIFYNCMNRQQQRDEFCQISPGLHCRTPNP